MVARVDLESYWDPAGTCLSFCSLQSQEFSDSHGSLYPRNWSVKGTRQQQYWNKLSNYSSNCGNNRQLALEKMEFIVATSCCPGDLGIIFPVGDLTATPPAKVPPYQGLQGHLHYSHLDLHLTSRHHMNEELKGLSQILWEFTWRQWRYETRYSLFPCNTFIINVSDTMRDILWNQWQAQWIWPQGNLKLPGSFLEVRSMDKTSPE